MKILMVLEHTFPPDIRVEKEIKTLIRANLQITLACTTKSALPEEDVWEGCRVVRFPRSEFIYKSSIGCLSVPFYFNFWRRNLRRLLKEDKYQAIHIHDLPLARVGSELSKEFKLRFILDLHENYPCLLQEAEHTKRLIARLFYSHNQWLAYEKQMLKSADAILSVIEEQRERFIRLGAERENVYLLPNYPEIESLKFRACQHDENKITFIYAGNIDGTRGLDLAIDAMARLKSEFNNFRFRIVGTGKVVSDLKDRVLKLNLSEEVEFLGWQKLDKIYQMLSEADVALLPQKKNSNSDFGIPNKLFQYMLAGRSVIASDCRAVERILTEGQAGLIFKHNSVSDLSEKLLYSVKNRAELEEMGKRGRKLVIEKYNWSQVESELIKVYS